MNIKVYKLSEDMAEDYISYFDNRAFLDGDIEKAVIAFKMWGLLKYIDVVAASAELGVAKPDREIFEKAFEMDRRAAQEAVIIWIMI